MLPSPLPHTYYKNSNLNSMDFAANRLHPQCTQVQQHRIAAALTTAAQACPGLVLCHSLPHLWLLADTWPMLLHCLIWMVCAVKAWGQHTRLRAHACIFCLSEIGCLKYNLSCHRLFKAKAERHLYLWDPLPDCNPQALKMMKATMFFWYKDIGWTNGKAKACLPYTDDLGGALGVCIISTVHFQVDSFKCWAPVHLCRHSHLRVHKHLLRCWTRSIVCRINYWICHSRCHKNMTKTWYLQIWTMQELFLPVRCNVDDQLISV